MQEAWERVRQRVRELRLPVGPCLSPAALESFERQHCVRLPEDYRWFLANVGNGSVGPPFFGLVPIGETWDWSYPEDREFWGSLPAVAEPFPFTEKWWWDDTEPTWDTLRNRVWKGSISLGTDGCGLGYYLIVSGPERGQIWEFHDLGINPVEPRHGFAEWFSAWLERKREAKFEGCLDHPNYRRFKRWLGEQSAEQLYAPSA
jgi:hypothetical protein